MLTIPGFTDDVPPLAPPPGVTPDNPFLQWFSIDEQVIRKVLAELTRHGADDADLFFEHSRDNALTLEDGIISRATTSVDQGVGLRVVVGDQTGYAYTEDLSLSSMLEAARTAAAIAKSGTAAPPQAFGYSRGGHQLYDLQHHWWQVGVNQKLPMIERINKTARAHDPAVNKVMVHWGDAEKRILVANLSGQIHVDLQPMTRIVCVVSATKDGATQSGSSNISGRKGVDWLSNERLDALAKESVDKTMFLFEATQPPAGELPVVLAAGASGILLHEAIGHGMEADFNRKGVSIYADMIGKKIAPETVTIVDDGTLPGERGSINFDDEGNPSKRTTLVDKGILATYLHDSISARHYGVDSTGSGRRESFRHAPMPRMRCTFMEDGPHTYEEIVASVDKGIVAETFTNGQVQIGAGDFTFYIKSGWLIENGRITAPIKDCNIIGNGPDALMNVTMVGNDGILDDGGWTCGKDGQRVPVSQGMPSVLVKRLTVGGHSG